AGMGIGLEELRGLSGAVWKSGETHYEKYLLEVKVPEGAQLEKDTGILKDKGGKPLGVKMGEKILRGFDTPSRKLEFYSKQLEEK
ncbi:MAG: hypothetical protein Q6354_08000, partial [Candidatus Brocadiales bacterium]|nr:hypothetical protein [Candidatus Brocadiales bacterium]